MSSDVSAVWICNASPVVALSILPSPLDDDIVSNTIILTVTIPLPSTRRSDKSSACSGHGYETWQAKEAGRGRLRGKTGKPDRLIACYCVIGWPDYRQPISGHPGG